MFGECKAWDNLLTGTGAEYPLVKNPNAIVLGASVEQSFLWGADAFSAAPRKLARSVLKTYKLQA